MREVLGRSWIVVARGLALFLGLFTIVGIAGELRGSAWDQNLWWIDLRDFPAAARMGLLAAFAIASAAWAVRLSGRLVIMRAVAALTAVLCLLACRDVVRFGDAVAAGGVHPALPVPLSAFIAMLLGALVVTTLRWKPSLRQRRPTFRGAGLLVASAIGWAIAFPIALMLFFGTTDYRRPADVAVVFGARVYATGRPSPLLADRIRTGVELYRDGLVPLLIMSGGDGADGFNEAVVMRDEALKAGVDPSSVIVDRIGVSTEATIADTARILEDRFGSTAGHLRVIAVSQAYHLPRVQLAFAHVGWDVFTVPAAEAQPIRELPLLMLREVPAFWIYFVRVCLL
ncbi:MAG: YdcF family protein [Chloroflexota bacterium]